MATAAAKQSQTSSEKLDVKQAANLALQYFADLYPNEHFADVALEEVEMSEDEKFWLITLGFTAPPPLQPSRTKPIATLFGPPGPVRKFKVFKVNARTGKVVSMRIRKLE